MKIRHFLYENRGRTGISSNCGLTPIVIFMTDITNHCSRPLNAAAEIWRVCRAWHSTSQVQVLIPGVRKAEG